MVNGFNLLNKSLRLKLLFIFIASTFIPIFIITNIVTYIYIKTYNQDISDIAETSLTPLSTSISQYLVQLDRLTLSPYSNDMFLYALKLKANDSSSSSDTYNMIISSKYFGDNLDFIDNSRNDITNILLVKNDKCLFYSNHILNNEIIDNYNFSQQDWYQKTLMTKNNVLFCTPHNQDYFKIQNNVFSVSRVIMDVITKVPICVMKVDIYPKVFDEFISNINFKLPSNFVILNEDNLIVYNSNHLPLSDLNNIDFTKQNVKFKNETYKVLYKTITPYNWKICILLSNTHINNRIKFIYLVSFIVFFICLMLTIIVYQLLSKGLLQRLKNLTSVINSIESNNLDVVYTSTTNDELDRIGKELNIMAYKLKEYIKNEYVLTIKQKNAEYKALQAQIHPHFLFNVLTGFIGLNSLGEKAILENSLLDLTFLLRYSLYENDFTTLKNELSFIEKYCNLQKLRFGDRLSISIEGDELELGYTIPKLLLQPFIENAIIHGIEPLDKKCLLQIKIKKECINNIQTLQILISDDGKGFCLHTDKNQNSSSSGIGIKNSMDRLKICFPNSSFNIESVPNEGTIIKINIPEGELNNVNNNS